MKFQKTLKGLTKRSESISLDKRFEKLNWAIRGLVNYFRISRMKTFLRIIDEHFHIRRMIIWKQWKRPQTRTRNLVKCVKSFDEARGLANCRRGDMFVAYSKILQNAIFKIRLTTPNKKERTKRFSLRS